MKNFNKTIWICWFQGWDNAPDVSKLCVESWKYHNPDWNIVLLDQKNMGEYVNISEVLPTVKTNPTAFSDILRLFLLKNHGGVWVDSTCFCNRPLNDWLFDHVDDAWLYWRKDRKIASWFIAAEKGSYIIDYWYNRMVQYWTDRMNGIDKYDGMYMWVHQLFVDSCGEDEKFNQIHESWKHIDCTSDVVDSTRGAGPHFFVPYHVHMNTPMNSEVKARIDSKDDFVYKLTFKTPINWRDERIPLRYLVKTIDIDLTVE